MIITVISTVYPPDIGGSGTVAELLARGLTELGHVVHVVTRQRLICVTETATVRASGFLQAKQIFASDAVIMIGAPLTLAWPLLLSRRPSIVSHQIGMQQDSNPVSRWLRNVLVRRGLNVSCSDSLSRALGIMAHVVRNPYDDQVFTPSHESKTKDVVFVGRLVPEKGAQVLIDAVGELVRQHRNVRATIIGDGPMLESLKKTTLEKELSHHIEFRGPMRGASLAQEISRHKIMVVPSIWQEPFGIVALEGIACGCAVIASNSGGLPEAFGPCGIGFRTGDAEELASAIDQLITNTQARERLLARASEHLTEFTPARVSARYLRLLES